MKRTTHLTKELRSLGGRTAWERIKDNKEELERMKELRREGTRRYHEKIKKLMQLAEAMKDELK